MGLWLAVMGCADPPTANDGRTWKRRGTDTMTIGCTGSDRTWKLTCIGNQWVGTYSNCTAGVSIYLPPLLLMPPISITIIIII